MRLYIPIVVNQTPDNQTITLFSILPQNLQRIRWI